MKCPIDSTPLQMSDRQGVEIDYCPQCRGVWLDRGELDKIIEKSDTGSAPMQAQSQHRAPEYREEKQYRSHDNYGGHHKKKKENFLSEIFDF